MQKNYIMKLHKTLLVLALVFISALGLNAQDKQNPWAIEIGTNAVDFYPVGLESGTMPNGINGEPVHGSFINEYFNAGDHYNMMPSVSRVGVGRHLISGLSLNVGGAINKIDKLGDADVVGWNNDSSTKFYSLDARLNFSFQDAFGHDSWFDPYVGIGAGRTWVKYGYALGYNTLNANVGFKFWVMKDLLAIDLASTYKSGMDDQYSQDYFQHHLGLVFQFGAKDTDGDGVSDSRDECPSVPGLKEFNGCPDTDGDGIEDAKDNCPEVAGITEFNGCPDTDGDGTEDAKDACPTQAGPAEFGGCPDSDGDGVADPKDGCPEVAGVKELGGCPDRDGDGVADKDDACPDDVGTVVKGGCPEMTMEIVTDLNESASALLFLRGKSDLSTDAKATLDQIASVMKEYATTYLEISGHTCNIDTADFNQELSESRAKVVRNYLIEAQGISPGRLSAKGYGESKPVADNAIEAGRVKNRRVEISIEE